ncbi:MAG: tyrosine-type recombinase/integrase [Myxococcales bacterium]|nr:tyrosine-type recombinase/integrase [Myxococcales bacterium]
MAARRDKQKGWIVDFVFAHADGSKQRVRKRSPVQTRKGAEAYERQLRQELLCPRPDTNKEVPTLKTYSAEFLETYVETNNKPSEKKSKKRTFEQHLNPQLGQLRLDCIGAREIERYKSAKVRQQLSPKTINNHLTVLRKALSVAQEWGYIEHLPAVKWLRVPDPSFDFLDFDEARRLVDAADPEWTTMILLALRTGLRQGELLGLQWADLQQTGLVVRRSRWRGHETPPKNGRTREVPLSPQTQEALRRHRHLRSKYVFCSEDGRPLCDGQCKWPLWRACRKAGIHRFNAEGQEKKGVGWHVLRHTFASHLVMKGRPLKAAQELLGHSTIEMTMRYAHLSPDVRESAVACLDERPHGTNVAPQVGAVS